MKKLTIHFLTITLAMIVLGVTIAHAHKRVKLKDGKAKITATVKPNGKVSFSILGADFKKLDIKQTKGGKFKYEIKRGSEFLSSGHSTGFQSINSDGRSVYSITIINTEAKARPITLSFINDGTEP